MSPTPPDFAALGRRLDAVSVPDSALRSLLTNGGTFGQALACGLDRERLARLMSVHSAAVEVLSNNNPEAMALREDIIQAGMQAQATATGADCENVAQAVDKIEQAFRDKGLMKD